MNIEHQFGTLPTYEELLKRHPDYFEQALTSKIAAEFVDSTPAGMAQMRTRGTGPQYIRLPTKTLVDRRSRPRGPIRYIRRDLIEWLQSQKRFSNTAQEVVELDLNGADKGGENANSPGDEFLSTTEYQHHDRQGE